MFGPSGVPCAPWQEKSGAGRRLRSGAFSASAFGCLALLSAWWFPAGAAQAASYPPSLGCAVTGTADSGGIRVQGIGFQAGSVVRISAGGRRSRTVADAPAPSRPGCPPGFRLRHRADRDRLRLHRSGRWQRRIPRLLRVNREAPRPGGQPGALETGRAGQGQHGPSGAGPAGPSRRCSRAGAAAIPVDLAGHVPSQLFLGLAGAVLLTGAALTGLTGRWGHRAEARPSRGASVSGTEPVAPESA